MLGIGAGKGTGSNNTALGAYAMMNNSTGSGNIQIGGRHATSGNNVIESSPVFNITTHDNRIVMGSTLATNAYIQIPWTVVSDERDKAEFQDIPHGLEFVTKLKPI